MLLSCSQEVLAPHWDADALDTRAACDEAHCGEHAGEWFVRAMHLAHLACVYQRLEARGEMGTPDRPYSLYAGVAGMVCA